jgi:hypothetical protein
MAIAGISQDAMARGSFSLLAPCGTESSSSRDTAKGLIMNEHISFLRQYFKNLSDRKSASEIVAGYHKAKLDPNHEVPVAWRYTQAGAVLALGA